MSVFDRPERLDDAIERALQDHHDTSPQVLYACGCGARLLVGPIRGTLSWGVAWPPPYFEPDPKKVTTKPWSCGDCN